jgi:voltage-gated sodium channel
MISAFKSFFLSERNIMILILLNAVLVFLMYFPELASAHWLIYLDNFILVLFILEMGVKLYLLKPNHFFKDKWNQFDFTVILLSLPSLVEGMIDIPNTSLILVLRVLRLIRLVRFFRFVPHLGMIIDGLGRALRSSVFVFVALLFFNFLLALLTCHFYQDIAPEYFGNPLISAYSIFQMFTVEGWHEIPQAIAERTDNSWIIGVTRIYFLLIVFSGGILGMSFANAIFVDEMTMDNTKDLESKIDRLEEHILELQKLMQRQQNGDA